MHGIDPARCPICGGPNECARAGDSAAAACDDCWCARTTIAEEVLARVPVAARGLACVCPRCARSRPTDGHPPPGRTRE